MQQKTNTNEASFIYHNNFAVSFFCKAQTINTPKSIRADTLIIQFIVEKDGSVTHAKVIKHLDDELDNEALRVVSNSPKWKPGIQNGHKVRVYYTIPFNFTIANE
jgi:TonB family protein